MTTFVLKLIALTTMLIDHTGAVLQCSPDTSIRQTGDIFRIIGRVAFPIYAFLISEGMKKTRSKEKYLFRLFLFAFISFVPFSLFVSATNGGDIKYFTLEHTNVFLTLFLGAAAIWCYDRLKKINDLLAIVPVFALAWLSWFLKTDYSIVGILIIFLAYVTESRWYRVLAIAFGVFYFYAMGYFFQSSLSGTVLYIYVSFSTVGIKYLIAGGVSCLLLLLYNGKPGPKKLKWFFYVFYPAHLLMFYLLLFVIL